MRRNLCVYGFSLLLISCWGQSGSLNPRRDVRMRKSAVSVHLFTPREGYGWPRFSPTNILYPSFTASIILNFSHDFSVFLIRTLPGPLGDVPPVDSLTCAQDLRHEQSSPPRHKAPSSSEKFYALVLPVVWLQLHHSRWANGSQRQEIIIKSVISDFRHPDQQQHISSRSPSHHATPSAPWISIPSSPLHHAPILCRLEKDGPKRRGQ